MVVLQLRKMLFFVFICTVYAKEWNVDEESVPVMSAPLRSKLVKNRNYRPTWEDLDTRELPQWYDAAKIGILVHWGVYSVPSFKSECFWHLWRNGDDEVVKFMNDNYNNGFSYQEFAPMLTSELFDPEEWAKVFAKAGAKYVVLTTKHQDGFALFPSRRSFSWNAVDVGPKLDIVKSLSKTVRRAGMKFGVFYSLYEWYNPIYLSDKETQFKTQAFTDTKVWPDIKHIVYDYKPSILWSYGDWEASDAYWKSPELLAWLYNESPVNNDIVVNDRWGNNTNCLHGDFCTCGCADPKEVHRHKWENAFSLDNQSWGYRRNMRLSDVMSIHEILENVVKTVSRGGNVLINVGVMKDGILDSIFQERLYQLGDWLEINGEAIYDTSPWFYHNDHHNSDVWYTCKKDVYNYKNPIDVPRETDMVTVVYLIILKWPAKNIVRVSDLTNHLQRGIDEISFLDPENFKNLFWQMTDDLVEITVPDVAMVASKEAWTLKITYKRNIILA